MQMLISRHMQTCTESATCLYTHTHIQAQAFSHTATHTKTSFQTHRHEYIPTGVYTQTYFPKQTCAHKHLCAFFYTYAQACPHNCIHLTSINRYPLSHTWVFRYRKHRCIQSNTCKHTQPHTLFVHFSTQPHLYTHAPPHVHTNTPKCVHPHPQMYTSKPT